MKYTNDEYINFSRRRNLGSMLGDTINFLKLEGRPFFTSIIKVSIIPILLTIAFGVYYDLYDLSKPDVDIYSSNFLGRYSYITDWQFLVATLMEFIAYGFIVASAYTYIKSYWENKGRINAIEIEKESRQKAISYMGLYALTFIIIRVGLIFLIVPGVYLSVVLSVAGCLLIFENRDVFDSFGHSFDFMKGYWWETFGCLLIYGIFVFIIAIVLSLPILLYGFNDLFGEAPSYVLIEELTQDPIYIGLLGVARVIDLFFTVVSVVFTAFIYFDIYEQKHPSQGEIDSIGTR